MARILVVDDEDIVRRTIQSWLEREGFEVVSAKDGRDALAAVSGSEIDVVVIDIFMPGMGGLEAITALHQRVPTVPIIAISGYMFGDSTGEEPDFLAMAAEIGVAYCLQKPFRPRHLVAALEACLGKSGTRSNDRAAGA